MATKTKILAVLIVLMGATVVASAQTGPGAPSRVASPDDPAGPPPAWRPGDPADSLYRAAREALNRGDYRLAANLFMEIAERFPDSAYAPDALYWNAFALYRIGGSDDLRAALRALELQRARYPQAATRGDADALTVRIRGALASQGDAKAAEELFEFAWQHLDRPPRSPFYAKPEALVDVATTIAEANAEATRTSEKEVEKEVEKAVRQAMEAATKAAAWSTEVWGTNEASDTRCPDRDHDDMRVAALNALLQMDADRALPILRQVLARRDECSASLRRMAVFLVSQQRTPETEDLLLELARDDPDPEVRRQAVFWLSQVPSERAVRALEDVLENSDDAALQEHALFALSQQRSPRASRALRSFAEQADAPEELREKAIFWLGQQRSPENAEFLRDLFRQSTSRSLKERVLFALSQMRGHGNERWLLEEAVDPEEPIEIRKKALFFAGQAGAPIDDLVDLYDRIDDHGLKEQLIFTYAQRHDRAAIDKLMDIVRTERDRDLRQKALFWLGQSEDPRVIEFFQEILTR